MPGGIQGLGAPHPLPPMPWARTSLPPAASTPSLDLAARQSEGSSAVSTQQDNTQAGGSPHSSTATSRLRDSVPATSYNQGTARTRQGLASQNNVDYFSENYQYNYHEYILNLNQSYENSQNILKTTLTDLKDTLGHLENEYQKV